MARLGHLFQPIRIGPMEVDNRIVMPAMDMGFGIDDNGFPTSQLTEYLVERARSRPGMIVTGNMPINLRACPWPVVMHSLHLWEEGILPGLQEMVSSVHAYGVKFGVQLMHVGVARLPEKALVPWIAPEFAYVADMLEEMSKADIKECILAHGEAAERCARAGFDFVEIHSAHSYLLSQFLSPHYNQRADEYGGSFENRIRLLLEVIDEVRDRIGGGVAIGVKVNGDDGIGDDGWTVADLCRLAPLLEEKGVNYIAVTYGGSFFGTGHECIPSMYVKEGSRVHLSEEVKRHVSIPVMTVGRIKDPIMADRIIAEGKADLVCIGRAQIADPEMVEKARRGDLADIKPCIGECLGCIEGVMRRGEASCSVNPRLGREHVIKDIQDEKKAVPKLALVAGAGYAGMEAARQAAFSGHKVILCDSRGWIGGQARLAAKIPERQEIADMIPWYERQLNKLGVQIRLNTTVDEDLLEEIHPDVLVVATGSLPEVPVGYLGDLANIANVKLLTVDQVLEDEIVAGDSVLVVGGDQIGLQIADYLCIGGRKVCVVERETFRGAKMAAYDRTFLVNRIERKGVSTNVRVQKVEILPTDEIWIVDEAGRKKVPLIDTIVLASDRRPNRVLEELAERKGIETYVVGDAGGVADCEQGTIMAAIASGYDAARQI